MQCSLHMPGHCIEAETSRKVKLCRARPAQFMLACLSSDNSLCVQQRIANLNMVLCRPLRRQQGTLLSNRSSTSYRKLASTQTHELVGLACDRWSVKTDLQLIAKLVSGMAGRKTYTFFVRWHAPTQDHGTKL